MKRLLFIIALGFSLLAQAQILNPVKWTTSVEKLSDTEYNLVSTAILEKGWKIYGLNVPEGGPVATSFTFPKSADYQLVGKMLSVPQPKTEHEEMFDMVISFYYDKVMFKQRIKVLKSVSTINASVEFMSCNDRNCLAPKSVDLSFAVNAKVSGQAAAASAQQGDNHTQAAAQSATLQPQMGGIIGSQESNTEQQTLSTESNSTQQVASDTQSAKPTAESAPLKAQNVWTIFFLSFLSGFLALLTPCVFPMIPMTVSYFTKQSKTKAAGVRNAIFYGVSIVVIYVLLGSVVTAAFGADSLNALSSSVIFNLVFFVILVVFSISFLGAFEITLPSSWSTKVDAQADRKGFVGIFFMALALAIVSFSCTGPIVGTLLVQAATEGGIAPVMGMLGFSLAIALPFTLFAAFPGWLNAMPKSGGWLNTVKVVLGFVELALAFKFLSNADMVVEGHWVEREVFIAIWIAIFATLTLYLFGKIRLPHDSPVEHISVGRLGLGLTSLVFTLYLLPGLWGAPLHLISAFPPPQHYSESPYGVGYSNTGGGADMTRAEAALPHGAHLFKPHNIVTFEDYEEGLAYAKQVGKPVLIDFTGKACVNCRKMENNVWTDSRVLEKLKNEVVLISLFVDDKRDLPADKVVPSVLEKGKMLTTIGKKWSEFQTVRYQSNSQPFYVLMGHDEQNLVPPVGYTPDADEYTAWLEKGINAFKNK